MDGLDAYTEVIHISYLIQGRTLRVAVEGFTGIERQVTFRVQPLLVQHR